ncbi:MAG: vitamin K epoxide reductase family protein [Candidatus Marinimicrobia bacterium]|nr:vitamin K epoxide reductase family protein [Candidatus Neomarinimicrobiota bacterium]
MNSILYFIGALLAIAGGAFSFYFYAVSTHRMLYSQWWVPRICQIELPECVAITKTKYGQIFGMPNALSGSVFLIFYAYTLFSAALGWVPSALPFVMGILTIIIGLYLIYGLFKLKTVCPICITIHTINLVIFILQLVIVY